MSPIPLYLGIKAVIIKDDRLLLLKRVIPHETFWEVPGGRMEPNETLVDTLTRELHEELPGIQDIQVQNIINGFKKPEALSDGFELFLLYVRVTADTSSITISDEHKELRWVTLAEMQQLNPPVRHVYASFFEG